MRIGRLETERLIIREYALSDFESHRALMHDAFDSHDSPETVQHWLKWTMANYIELERMYQPPYGDYVITLKSTGEMIGAVGLVPSMIPWNVLPEFNAGQETGQFFTSPEFGLFWAMFAAHRGQGYAVEAGAALCQFMFTRLNVARLVATTEFDNIASKRVMEKLGMTLYRNPGHEPAWFQVVGLLNHPQ